MKDDAVTFDADVDRASAPIWQPMQWRSSDDGITWTRWRPLLSVHDWCGPWQRFFQGRIFVRGEWDTSPVSSWD